MRRKHPLINGDLIIIIAVAFGVMLAGGGYVHMSSYDKQSAAETEVVNSPVNDPQAALQLDTFDIKRCTDKTAIDFLIDVSGSMQFGTKMPELKKALHIFAGKFPSTGAIALQSFSNNVEDRLSFGLFKDEKDNFLYEVDAMKPETATRSKDAFIAAQRALEKGMQMYPDYKFNLVFISDGIPETGEKNKLCPGGQTGQYCAPHPMDATACRCYDTDQDPTAVASGIKEKGVRIFTIALVDPTEAKFDNELQRLMYDVASSPRDYYRAPLESQLTDIVSQIQNRFCTLR